MAAKEIMNNDFANKAFNPDESITINCSHENGLKGWSIGGAGVMTCEDEDDEKSVFVPTIYLKSPYECVVEHNGEPLVGRFALVTQDDMAYGPRITGDALMLDNGRTMRLGKDDVIDWTKAHDVNDSKYKVTGYESIGDGSQFFSKNKKTIESLFCDVRKTLSNQGLYKFGWGNFKESPPSNIIERRNGSISIKNLDRNAVDTYSYLSSHYSVTVPVPKSFSDSGIMRLVVPKEDVDRPGPGVWEKTRLNFDRKTESFSARVLRDGQVENIVISAEDVAKQHGQYLHDEAIAEDARRKEEQARRDAEKKAREEAAKAAMKPVSINNVLPSKIHNVDALYPRVSLTVPPHISDNGHAQLTVWKNQLSQDDHGNYSINFKNNQKVGVLVKKNGMIERRSVTPEVLADLHNTFEVALQEYKSKQQKIEKTDVASIRRLPDVPDESKVDDEMQMQ